MPLHLLLTLHPSGDRQAGVTMCTDSPSLEFTQNFATTPTTTKKQVSLRGREKTCCVGKLVNLSAVGMVWLNYSSMFWLQSPGKA